MLHHEHYHAASGESARTHASDTHDPIVRDEVCGMEFPRNEAAATLIRHGTTYFFCSERCRSRFQEHPEWYVSES